MFPGSSVPRFSPDHNVQITLTSTTLNADSECIKTLMELAQRDAANSFVPKILPVTDCSPWIFSRFPPKLMIPIDRGGGGVPAPHPDSHFGNSEFFSSAAVFFASLALAQAQRGTLVHEESIRVSPSADTAKLGTVERGYELVIIDSSRDWAHVEAILRDPRKDADEDDDESQGKTITGWVPSKALVSMSTPNGDKIVFGEAADSEDEASRRRGRRDAAQDAMRLYYRVYDLFPASPLAAEGLYRAADIRWQMERSDMLTRPSARERDAYMRGQIDEEWMKLVMKKFPGTKWADLACLPSDRKQTLRRLARRVQVSRQRSRHVRKVRERARAVPAAPEALYQAAWRRSALIEIYKTEANQKKSEESKNRALALAQQIVTQYGQSDWSPARPEPDLLRAARRPDIRKRERLILSQLHRSRTGFLCVPPCHLW